MISTDTLKTAQNVSTALIFVFVVVGLPWLVGFHLQSWAALFVTVFVEMIAIAVGSTFMLRQRWRETIAAKVTDRLLDEQRHAKVAAAQATCQVPMSSIGAYANPNRP